MVSNGKNNNLNKKKLKLGWFTFTCCEGCGIVFIELLNDYFKEWSEKIEFRHFKLLKSKNYLDGLDLAVVEGAISTKHDLEILLEVRKKSKYVMAVGSCAITSMPAGLRNNFSKEKTKEIEKILEKFDYLEKVEPVSKFIKVDAEVPGCPMNPDIFIEKLNYFIKNIETDS